MSPTQSPTTRKERATKPSPNQPGNGRSGPIRTCIGCRTAGDPAHMVRLAMQDGRLTTDRYAGGRGAWICPDTECLRLAAKRRALARALRTEVPPDAHEGLGEVIAEGRAFSPGGRS